MTTTTGATPRRVGLGENAPAPAPDLGLFFASALYPDLQLLLDLVEQRSASSVLIGCTRHGVMGGDVKSKAS